jgi:peptide subunit release factor 1 (eRF1)
LIDRLAAFEPSGFPVISLYLNTQADGHGRDRDRIERFVRRELADRVRSFPPRSTERESVEKDAERIRLYVRDELQPSSNGLALFACTGADLFEAVQVEAPIDEDQVFVADQPHVYPLARLEDQYPRYAALLLDSRSARLFVFGTGRRLGEEHVESPKTNRTSVGGWSQA